MFYDCRYLFIVKPCILLYNLFSIVIYSLTLNYYVLAPFPIWKKCLLQVVYEFINTIAYAIQAIIGLIISAYKLSIELAFGFNETQRTPRQARRAKAKKR